MTAGGAASRQYPFKFHTGNHVWQPVVLIIVQAVGVKRLVSGRQDNRTYADGNIFFLILKINGAGGTEFFTDPAAALLLKIDASISFDHIFQGYRLGVGHIDGLAFVQPFIKCINGFSRAFFRAKTAGNAFFHVYITGSFCYADRKISLFATDFSDCRQR